MIAVTIQATQVDKAVVTTYETINEDRIQEVFTPIVAQMMELASRVSGVFPAQVTLMIAWADGEVKPDAPKAPEPPTQYSSPHIPPWMS